VVLTVDEAVEHLGDALHDWHNLSFVQRVEEMDLCLAGLCSSPWLGGARAAFDLIGLEGLIEQFGGRPDAGGWLDQPYAYVEAFAVIRSTRNAIADRMRKEAEANAKR
jgi:hypothetical protein